MTIIYLDYKTTDVGKDLIQSLQHTYKQNILEAYERFSDVINTINLSEFTFDLNQNTLMSYSQKRILEKSINRSIKYYFKLQKSYFNKSFESLIEDTFLVFSSNDLSIGEGNPCYILLPELCLTLSTDFNLKSVINKKCKLLINSKQLIVEIDNDNSIISH